MTPPYRTIELRSDTFTLPTPEMLAAILQAELGDDGYREDPTVIRLEELIARRLGKAAACLMPSGTMANLASLLAHCPDKGGVVLAGDKSDILAYEDEGLAARLGVRYLSMSTARDGKLALSEIAGQFTGVAASRPALLCLENPHNLCGGLVLQPGYLQEAADLVHSHGAMLHLDGARVFNAAVQLKTDVQEVVRSADSVQCCLSKGLAAPIGSMVAGGHAFIERVRNKRRMLGGNMRQAGIIAAAGIVAVNTMVDRLQDDHANARRLAEGLHGLRGLEVDLETVQTNTVVFRVRDKRFTVESFLSAALQQGIRLSDFKFGRIRAVTHYGIVSEDIDYAIQVIARILEPGPCPDLIASRSAVPA
jgi:threonine aldolase